MNNQLSPKLNIVVYSSTFYPNVGGLEYIMKALSSQWSKSGHEVTVVTPIVIDSDADKGFSFNTVRTNSLVRLFKLARKADVFVEANISLRTALVGCLFRKKWWVIHHVHYQHGSTSTGKLKNLLTYISKNIAVSHFLAKTLAGSSNVIHNCYASQVFNNDTSRERKRELLFVGRLVSDKGIHFLLDLFVRVKIMYPTISLTIVGSGPEEAYVQRFIQQHHLQNSVCLLGSLDPASTALQYQSHQILLVPSLWDEPFGVILLEGLASGIQVIASKIGGLPEAGKNFVVYKEAGKVDEWIQAIDYCLQKQSDKNIEIESWLLSRTEESVANEYLQVFKN